jgi:protein required for attachment to host cells
MKHTRTWILVADGGRARILETTGKRQGMHLVAGSQSRLDNPPSRELGRDTPGRVYESVGHARHAVEPRSDPHTALEALFASQLATMLADHSAKEAFDRLVIVAPAAMLGNLRRMIKPEVRNKIVAEIDKDLTRIPNNEIASHIDNVIDV